MITCFTLWCACLERPSFYHVLDYAKCPLYIDLRIIFEPFSTYLVLAFGAADKRVGRTYDGPVSCARDPKCIALYVPSHPPTQLGEPNPIHRILTLMTTLPFQIQPIQKRTVIDERGRVDKGRRRRAREPLVKRPGTARDRKIPGCVLEGRHEREPRRQFVRVVADEERAGLEVGYGAGFVVRRGPDVLRWVERVHVQGGTRVFGVVIPGDACPEVDAVAVVALGNENVCEEAISTSVGRCEDDNVAGRFASRTDPRSKKPPGGCGQCFQGASCAGVWYSFP